MSMNKQAVVSVARTAGSHDYRRNDACGCRRVEELEDMKVGAASRHVRSSAVAGGSELL